MNLLEAAADPHLFQRWFKDRDTWASWFAFLAALFALPMTADQLARFQACTGRQVPPSLPCVEAWLMCGRRAGKSFVLALVVVYLACFYDWRPYLAPGERGFIIIVAADRRQARQILNYLKALLVEVPMLAKLVAQENAESIELTNGITIEVATCSYRTVRGRTIIAALCDEVAFWPSEDSASPDYEVLDAIRPGMATVPGAMLLCASSPYARKGALYDAHARHYGKDTSPVLVWKAPTRTMNPTVPQSVIDDAMARDPASASAEYMAEFRTDVESFITKEAVAACIKLGLRERQPQRHLNYVGFVDPSGGSADAMTLGIAHKEGQTAILDLLREVKPPFSPEAVSEEFADVLKSYRITKVAGDRYAGEWPREQLRKHGVNYEVSDRSKSELYVDLLPLINSTAVDLLDNERLINQLIGLERRTSRAGKDSVDHGPGGHDDVANAAAGALCRAWKGRFTSRRDEDHKPQHRIGFADLKQHWGIRKEA